MDSSIKRRHTVHEALFRNKKNLKGPNQVLSNGQASQQSMTKKIGNFRRCTVINMSNNQADDILEKTEETKQDTYLSDKELEVEMKEEDATIHKKRRRKNVESRDAWTQTERSDYMLIKQKMIAKQKQIMHMIQMKHGEQVNGNSRQLQLQSDINNQSFVNALMTEQELFPQYLLEEYQKTQKQGLGVVNNFLPYSNQQNRKSSENIAVSQLMNMFQNQGSNDEMVQQFSFSRQREMKGINKTTSVSPSKKHRQLIQSRQQTNNLNNIYPSQQKRIALTSHGHRKQPILQDNHQSDIQSNNNEAQNDEGVNRTMTHWQKISSNNHALTKLFYQLPAGTKNLVQNAIQSQNKIQNMTLKGKKEYQRPYFSGDRKYQSPERKRFYGPRGSKTDIKKYDQELISICLRPKSTTGKKQRPPLGSLGKNATIIKTEVAKQLVYDSSPTSKIQSSSKPFNFENLKLKQQMSSKPPLPHTQTLTQDFSVAPLIKKNTRPTSKIGGESSIQPQNMMKMFKVQMINQKDSLVSPSKNQNSTFSHKIQRGRSVQFQINTLETQQLIPSGSNDNRQQNLHQTYLEKPNLAITLDEQANTLSSNGPPASFSNYTVGKALAESALKQEKSQFWQGSEKGGLSPKRDILENVYIQQKLQTNKNLSNPAVHRLKFSVSLQNNA